MMERRAAGRQQAGVDQAQKHRRQSEPHEPERARVGKRRGLFLYGHSISPRHIVIEMRVIRR
mgnify:CR=1 FL=1